MKTIYLDNNATTQVAPEVLEAMLPYFHDYYGNPSSMHSFGGQVAQKIRKAREQVAALLGALPDEIVFTSCGTESDNTAIRSALATKPEKRHIVTSRVEHPAVKSLCANLATQGYRVTELPVDRNGILDMEQLVASLTPDTAVVSLMWANNETGVLFPVEKAAELARERGILFHTDAVQAAGKIPIDMEQKRHRHALPFRTQAPRPQGDRCALCPQGDQVFALSDRGTSGEGPPGGHGEHAHHHRPGKGLRTGGPAPGDGKHGRSGACGTGWRRPSWSASPNAGSTAIPNSACPTRRTSASSSSKAKRSSCS